MQQKLKRIKKQTHALINCKDRNRNSSHHHHHHHEEGNKDYTYKKLNKPESKIISCIATETAVTPTVTDTQQRSSQQLFRLPNWLEKPQEKINSKNKKIKFNFNNQISKANNFKENTNYHSKKKSQSSQRNEHSRTLLPQKWPSVARQFVTSFSRTSTWHLLILSIFLLAIQCDKVRCATAATAAAATENNLYESTTPLQLHSISNHDEDNSEIKQRATTVGASTTTSTNATFATWSIHNHNEFYDNNATLNTLNNAKGTFNQSQNNSGSSGESHFNGGDSIFMRFAQRFSTGNELWDGIIRDCYQHPSFTCFQNNVYTYLNNALETADVNVTQRLKFYKNSVNYKEESPVDDDNVDETPTMSTTQAAMEGRDDDDEKKEDEHLLNNEIPHETGRAASSPETPIEEVTTALYGKSIKFAMTHDIEIQLPEMLFDGATFRISPRGFEGNGIIAKLELVPKQEIQARLAGKILMNKIKKFFRSKLLLSFLALVLIIKIIKIKLFWLLPLVIGIGAAKKLLLKFLLFLFPALSHLFKLCSYYQQTYHSTKYHHHHHLIDHHHTIGPAWHNEPHHPGPELIYTSPPKGHISAYLNGAPIHEKYGPPSFEHNEGNWESSGPGLGSDYISDINRAAQIEENSNLFKPHANDGNELHDWGIGKLPMPQSQQQISPQQKIGQNPLSPQQYISPQTQQQRPPPSLLQKQQQIQLQKNKQAQIQQQQQQQLLQQQQPQYHKPHATSQSFNPFGLNGDKQSVFSSKYKNPLQAQSVPRPVYTPSRGSPPHHLHPHLQAGHAGVTTMPALNNGVNNFASTAAQIAAQYEPTRHNPTQTQQQQPLSPELAAQLKEALRIQSEQRIVQQQQKILEQQPFVQDGQPLYPKNYDPFYSPLLLKIDKIVEQLGVTDDLCKERLICSMYKDPARYSPHSNFVSAELSRDTSELQPANSENPAVLRFYRLIQAARDGQDQRDCLQLYPQCSINTE